MFVGVFVGVLVGVFVGVLVGVGVIVGVTFVATAVIAHAVRLPRPAATLLATVVVAWQAIVAWGIWNDTADGLGRIAPGNPAGRLALWGISQRGIDLVAVVVAAAMAAAALALGGRLRLEALGRQRALGRGVTAVILVT